MIFCFTGTGNSLYAASLLESELVSIPQIMRQDELEFTAERIGIVAPVYGHEVPQMVRAFMQRAAFHTDYFLHGPDVRQPPWRCGRAGAAAMRGVWHRSGLYQCRAHGGQLAACL